MSASIMNFISSSFICSFIFLKKVQSNYTFFYLAKRKVRLLIGDGYYNRHDKLLKFFEDETKG